MAWPDALLELLDAVCNPLPVAGIAHLSLAATAWRGHGSAYAAIANGDLDADQIRDLPAAARPPQWAPTFAIDATTWSRCDAECSPDHITSLRMQHDPPSAMRTSPRSRAHANSHTWPIEHGLCGQKAHRRAANVAGRAAVSGRCAAHPGPCAPEHHRRRLPGRSRGPGDERVHEHLRDRAAAPDLPAACRSRKYSVTACTTAPSRLTSRYGSHASPVSARRPTWGTTMATRSRDGTSI